MLDFSHSLRFQQRLPRLAISYWTILFKQIKVQYNTSSCCHFSSSVQEQCLHGLRGVLRRLYLTISCLLLLAPFLPVLLARPALITLLMSWKSSAFPRAGLCGFSCCGSHALHGPACLFYRRCVLKVRGCSGGTKKNRKKKKVPYFSKRKKIQ